MSRILVTGATRGLGRALVNELSRRDHQVVATGRRLVDLADLPAAQRLVLDLTDPGSIEEAMAAAGELEVVINNAAMTVSGPVEAVPADLVAQVLATNVLGPLRVMQAVLPAMREQGAGRILNIADLALQPRTVLGPTAPLVVIAGTCMNSGKTYAATEIIKQGTRAGLRDR